MPHFGGVSGGVAPKIFGRKKWRLQLNNFTQKLDFDIFSGLGEEEHTRFRKKKREKTLKKEKPHRVGIWMKGYLKTFNHVKHFCRT